MVPYAEYIAVFFLAFLVFVFFIRGKAKTEVTLHGYQIDFLKNFAEVNSLSNVNNALDTIVGLAAVDPVTQGRSSTRSSASTVAPRTPPQTVLQTR